jgi:tetratricopeptide (TPR) repeat protein
MFKRKISSYLACFAFVLIISFNVGYGQAADIDSLKSQIIPLIQSGKISEADSITAVIMDLPDSNDKGHALQEIASAYQQAKEYDKTIKICDYVLKNWPKENFAIWSKMSLFFSQLGKGDINAANETTKSIVNEYTNNPYYVWVLSIVADGYCERRMDDKAQEIRDIVIDKSPESIWGKETEILSLINQRGYSIAKRRINSLITDFNGNPDLPQIVFRIGQEYCWKRIYSEAKTVFDRLITDIPDNSFTQKARLWSATANVCSPLVRQGKDEEATAAISKLINDFEMESGLPEAVYRIGQEFEWSKGEVAGAGGAANYNVSANIHRQLLQQFSKTPYGKQSYWDYKRLGHRINILTLIEKDDLTGAESAINEMAADLAGRPELAGEIQWIEMWSYDYQKYDLVNKLDERLIKDFHNTNESAHAFWRIARTIIDANEQANTTIDETIGYIKERFTNTSNRLAVLIEVAKNYQQKAEDENNTAYLGKAIRLYQEASQIVSSPDFYIQLGVCFQKLGKYTEAIDSYQAVINKWPNSPQVTQCLMSIEQCNIQVKSASAEKQGEGK